MDDPRGGIGGDGDEFEHRAAGVGTDHQESLLSLVVVFDESYRVPPCVFDVGVRDTVLSGTASDIRWSTLS